MRTVAISRFKATCHAVLERVRRTGEPVLVTRRGQPVAQVFPAAPRVSVGPWLGAMEGTGRIVGDVVSPAVKEADWEALLP